MRVSRKIRNLLRRERRANPSVEMRLAQGKAESPTKRQIRERFDESAPVQMSRSCEDVRWSIATDVALRYRLTHG